MYVKGKIEKITATEKMRIISDVVCEEYGINMDAILSKVRFSELIVPMYTMAYIYNSVFGISPEVSMEYIKRNRTMIYHVRKTISNLLETDSDYKRTYDLLINMINSRLDIERFSGKIVVDTEKKKVDFFSAGGEKSTYIKNGAELKDHKLNVIAKTILKIL